MRRPILSRSLAISVTAAALLLGSLSMAGAASAASNIAPTTTCANGMDNTGGLGLICQVTIVNTITSTGGRSTTTVRECHGAAGDPNASCQTTVKNLRRLVTNVDQCNDSINGGGGTLRCSVTVTNNFVGLSTGATAATVNQCVGSGDGIANECDPFPASTTNATITQCNGSANGGTLVQLKCTATGTTPASNGVTINQCNGSANGGGALVICSTDISNNRIALAAAATPTPTTSGSGSGSGTGRGTPTAPPTDTLGTTLVGPTSPAPILVVGLGLLAFAFVGRRLSRTGSR